jgi:hypothetical protein
MRVIDGMHRLRAAQLRGDHGVEVKFFDGDADEAFIAAVRANITHGLPLTLADRKAAAQRILAASHTGQLAGLARRLAWPQARWPLSDAERARQASRGGRSWAATAG